MIPLALLVAFASPLGRENVFAEYPAMSAYYLCAAEAADRLIAEASLPALAIADQALRSCQSLRGAAFIEFLSAAQRRTDVRDYVRARNLDAVQSRALAEREFGRAIRRQLMMNVARDRGETFREEDAESR
jgi:hypothetical protein